MQHLIRRTRFVAAGALAAVVLAACGGTDATEAPGTNATDTPTASESMESMDPNVNSGDPFALAKSAADHVVMSAAVIAGGIDAAANLDGETDSPAANLRAGLTGLLQEHVYLAGIAVDTAFGFGLDSAEFGLAAGALDTNSVALADAVGSIAGADNRDAFLDLWRKHIGFFVDYAKGAATDDADLQEQALANLDGYRGDAGAFFESITGGAVPADVVADNLVGHIETLAAAIDAAAAGDVSVFSHLTMAAAHVRGTAAALAAGITQAAGLEGDPNSPASELRSGLTALLQEHVYKAGLAVKTAYAAGADSDAFAAAAASLDENSVALADAVGSIAGADNRDAFLDLWRKHIGFFVDYAVGTAGGDTAAQEQALASLDGYRGDAGAFFESITGGALPADAIADNLVGHIDTLAATIRALAGAIIK